MFGIFGQSDRSPRDDENLAAWEASPSVPVTRSRSRKIQVLLANAGQWIDISYKGEARQIRPLSVFRKPYYDRTYVEAEADGQIKTFNVADVRIQSKSSWFRPIEGKPLAAASTAGTSLAGCFVVVAVFAGVSFVCCGGMTNMFDGLTSPPAQVASVPRTQPQPKPAPLAVPPVQSVSNEQVALPQTPPAIPAEQPPTIEPITPTPVPSTFGREFTDKTGEYHVRAEFVEFHQASGSTPSMVTLRKEDGSLKDVPMNSLSLDDQEWIRAEVKRRKGR